LRFGRSNLCQSRDVERYSSSRASTSPVTCRARCVTDLQWMRRWILALCGLIGCRGMPSAPDGGAPPGTSDGACKSAVPTMNSVTCPVLPPDGLACDLTDIASGWCSAPDCGQAVGCCSYAQHSNETCFSICGSCASMPRDVACVTQGTCVADSDCNGSLPHICQNCPLTPDGRGSQGCAHWICTRSQCEVAYCEAGFSCLPRRAWLSFVLPTAG
jgi:hypothetical protein